MEDNQKKKRKRPRAVLLGSTNDSQTVNPNPDVIGFNILSIKRKSLSGESSTTKKPKIEKEEVPVEEVPKLIKSTKTYGKVGKTTENSSSSMLNVLENEKDSLIGTQFLEVSIQEQKSKAITNPNENIAEATGTSCLESSSEGIKGNNAQSGIEDDTSIGSNEAKTDDDHKKKGSDPEIEESSEQSALPSEQINKFGNEEESSKTEGTEPVSSKREGLEQSALPSDPNKSKNGEASSRIEGSEQSALRSDSSEASRSEESAQERIVEVSNNGMPFKVIVTDSKKRDSINWNKYIEENIPEETAGMFLHRKRRSLNKRTNKSIEKQKEEEDVCENFEVKIGQPKIPAVKKARYGKKETYNQKTQEEKAKNIETIKNEVINEIEIKIETEQSQKVDEKLSRKQILIKFFQDHKYTVGMIERVNFILKMVKEDKIIIDTYKLVKSIRDNEIGKGKKSTVDRKSIVRLLIKLSQYGLIKYRKATLKSSDTEKTIQFICDPSFDDDETIISSILEESKIKIFLKKDFDTETIPDVITEPIKQETNDKDEANKSEIYGAKDEVNKAKSEVNKAKSEVGEAKSEVGEAKSEVGVAKSEVGKAKSEVGEAKNEVNEDMKQVFGDDQKTKDVIYKYNRDMPKKYGYCPKFARCRTIHELLFYLIYENQNEAIPESDVENILRPHGGLDVFENSIRNPIYTKEVSWKMFLSPIRSYPGWPKGWIMISDIILRLPLSIMVNVFNIPYEIPLLEEFLQHPIRKYFLIQNLPGVIRKGLIQAKKIIYWLIENLRTMCHLGLLQFGPVEYKNREQMMIYLNRKTTLYNTVKSRTGYHQTSDNIEYDRIDYELKSLNDVEQYWYDMWTICNNTPLGSRNSVAGEYVVIDNPATKTELVESLKPRKAEDAPKMDIGSIPGDKRGAAGFDSCLFAHLKRNWSWLNSIQSVNENDSLKTKLKNELNQNQNVDSDDQQKSIKVEKVEGEMAKTKAIKQKIVSKVEVPRFKIKPKEKKGKIFTLKKSKKRFEYDEIDRTCLANMKKLRTDWSELEDHIILLCTVASNYLCPNWRKQSIDYFVIRDVLHRIIPYSNDKSSRAVHRRVRYILKHPNTSKSLLMCLEEITHCEFIQEKFGTLTKKYQNSTIPTETLKIAFVELVALLNEKFQQKVSPKSKSPIVLPDTLDEVRSKYIFITHKKSLLEPPKFKDVESVYDIECDSVRSVIHSSLCSSKDKTSWAFQLFKIYQQYPEALLRQVINKIRADQLASMKKQAMLKIRSSTTILQSPFKLSNKYQMMLQMTQFRYQSLLEANSFLRNVLNWFESKRDDDVLDVTACDHGASLILENVLQKLNMEVVFEHPEQVIILDPNVKVDKAYERILNKFQEILNAQTNIVSIDTNSDSDEENVPHIPMDITELKSPCRIGFHMMRAELFNRNDRNNIQHMHDYFVVQASKVYLKPKDDVKVNESNRNDVTSKVLNDIRAKIILPDLLPETVHEELKLSLNDFNLVEDDYDYVETIKSEIYNAKEIGLTVNEIASIPHNNTLSFKRVIEMLENSHIILRVGTVCLRFVHFDFQKPWVTHADKILRLEKEKMQSQKDLAKWKGKTYQDKNRKIKILVAPWIRLDGSLNRRVLDRWLGAFVSTCVEFPGMTLQFLFDKYHLLKPTEIIFLVEQLVKIECVKLLKVNKPKVTLFSDVVDYGFEETDTLEDPHVVLIEPTEDCFYNFASFLGNKNYNTNFID